MAAMAGHVDIVRVTLQKGKFTFFEEISKLSFRVAFKNIFAPKI